MQQKRRAGPVGQQVQDQDQRQRREPRLLQGTQPQVGGVWSGSQPQVEGGMKGTQPQVGAVWRGPNLR